MKISKKVWIDGKVKWNSLRKRTLYKKNYYKGYAYVVCTSPHKHLLFEIIETTRLSQHYETATLLALCHTKEQAIDRVAVLVDELFNKQTITYTQLEQ